ncbi:cytochrome P450 20A1-like [Clytia hemisphaerica]|uniref:Uncharacterized protein n=1 Tax=Clytia hemisphaerica TaxID=252671 RepID=A0A7M5VGT5_9CNID|eukprot:TCONS_00047144-protein
MRQLITNIGSSDYLALATTAILLLIFTLVYLWWNERNQGKLSIPGLSSKHEIYGNLKQITKDGGLHQFLLDHHKKFGPMFSFYWGKELVVSLASPYAWKDTQTLFDRPANQFELFKPLVGVYSIQYMNTPVGQKHRKILDRHFSFTAIGLYFQTFTTIANELVTRWSKVPKDEMVPLRQHMLAVAIKSIIRTSFGEDYFKSNKEILELEAAYDVCWEEMERRLDGNMPEPDSDRQKNYDDSLNWLSKKVSQIVNHRKANKEKKDNNALDIMIDAEDLYTSDQQIFDMVISYIVGGFHTTGNLLTWAVYYLCNDSKVVDKMLTEINEVLGDGEITMDNFDKLIYARQVVDETMRCSVLAPYAARYSEYDMVIGGHVIPKHTPLLQALGCVLQDETIWPQPKRFDPDRFGPDAPKRHPLAFQPFGFAGKRKCPGYRFAYYEAIIFLVAIVRNFKVSLVPDMKVEAVHRLVTSPKEEIYINIEKR